MNTQTNLFKQTLTVLLAFIMAFTMMPSAVWADSIPEHGEAKTLVFTTDLDDSSVRFCPNEGAASTRQEIIEARVTKYYNAGGKLQDLPENITVNYQWYRNDKKWPSLAQVGGEAWKTVIGFSEYSRPVQYHVIATAEINGETYTAHSKTLTAKTSSQSPIQAELTVSKEGVLASAKDEAAAAHLSVTVVDLNGDERFTLDEALKAAHKAYLTTEDYITETSDEGFVIRKFWGGEPQSLTFFKNGKRVQSGADKTSLRAGDEIYASIDAVAGYCKFDSAEIKAAPGEEFTLTLADRDGTPLEGVQIGTWKKGAFTPLTGKVTDENGEVKLVFTELGDYMITAQGDAKNALLPPACHVTCAMPNGDCGQNRGSNAKYFLDLDTQILTISGSGETTSETSPWHKYADRVKEIRIEEGITGLYTDFSDCTNVEKVSFPSTLTQITNKGFYNCQKLKDVIFHEGCEATINSAAFAKCTALTEIVLPKGTKTFGRAAFGGCTALKKATVGAVSIGTFAGCDALTEVIYQEGVKSFGNQTFRATDYAYDAYGDCTSLETVTIPASLTEWGETPFSEETLAKVTFTGEGKANFIFEENSSGAGYSAIYNKDKTALYYVNPSVVELTIPATVRELNASMFSGFTTLRKVTFGEGSRLTEIPAKCFSGCSALTEISLPQTVTGIGSEAFSGCSTLKRIGLSSSLKTIGYAAFSGCKVLENPVLPEGLLEISANVFEGCEAITKLTLPQSLTGLGMRAFTGTAIEEIILPPKVTTLELNQFANCHSIKHIEVQGEVTEVPIGAFFPCSSLESIILPKSVKKIQHQTGVQNVYFSENAVVYYGGTNADWRSDAMDPWGRKCLSTVICNYVKPTTEEGKLEITQPLPEDIVVDDAAELTGKELTLNLKYPEGTTAESGDRITADWYYTAGTLNGLKGLSLVPESDYRLDGMKATVNLAEQAKAKPGTWSYLCVIFKTTVKGETTMLVSEPIRVRVRDTSFTLAGEGTEEAPYEIETFEHLELIAERTAGGENFKNTYFVLKNDDIVIQAGWQQIGTSQTPFEGTFDGDGHTITYAKGAKCLFRRVGSGTIKNLKVQGAYIASAGIASSMGPEKSGGKNASLINCTLLSGSNTLSCGLIGNSGGVSAIGCKVESGVKIGVDENGQPAAKGILGSIVGSGAFNLVSCRSGADLYSSGSYVGGLAGYKAFSMRDCSIKNSQFTGNIYADGEYIGGILGGGYDDQTAPNTRCAVIENCYVNANITGARAVGGLFGGEGGCDQCYDNGIGYIRNNVFYGSLTLNGKTVPAGSPLQCVPADNINGSKGTVAGFMRSLNQCNIIENNYYFITNSESVKGIGAVEHIDTSKIRPMGFKEGANDGTYYYDTSKDSLKDICDWVDREDGLTREYSGVSKSGMNRDDDPLGEDKDKLAKACTQEEMKNGSIVEMLNANASSMHNWVQGENCPVLSDEAVPYRMEAGGTYKNEYFVGDTLDPKTDLKDIVFTVTYSDGTTKELTINDVEISGFDSSKQAIVHLTASYQNMTCDFTVKINKKSGTAVNPKSTIDVKFTLKGDERHGEDGTSHTLQKGGLTTWIQGKTYTVDLNATVWDFLKEVEKQTASPKVRFNAEDSQYGKYIYSVTYNEDFELAEFDNGNFSGWMYTLNGKHPLLAVDEQFLEDGDAIVFHYTDDYTVEEGSEAWDDAGGMAGGVIEAVSDVTTDAKAKTTTAPTEVKVSEKTNADGTKTKVADVKVSADNQKEILKQAKASKSNEIILVVSSKSVGDAEKADVTLEKSFIDSIVKDTDAKLTIRTPFGDKTYTQEELKAMSEAATGSTITVTIEKAAEPADDAAANIAKAKYIVKDMKLVARSSKTAKKNIKAVLKSDAKVKASIKELKDLGFTVKYRFYRSTKKAASYKSTVTKKTASYTNTRGKKGTKYFYKVQVRVYDESGKLVAKTALKQCKYAARTWSKAK